MYDIFRRRLLHDPLHAIYALYNLSMLIVLLPSLIQSQSYSQRTYIPMLQVSRNEHVASISKITALGQWSLALVHWLQRPSKKSRWEDRLRDEQASRQKSTVPIWYPNTLYSFQAIQDERDWFQKHVLHIQTVICAT
jgi:hypothetical protein